MFVVFAFKSLTDARRQNVLNCSKTRGDKNSIDESDIATNRRHILITNLQFIAFFPLSLYN